MVAITADYLESDISHQDSDIVIHPPGCYTISAAFVGNYYFCFKASQFHCQSLPNLH